MICFFTKFLSMKMSSSDEGYFYVVKLSDNVYKFDQTIDLIQQMDIVSRKYPSSIPSFCLYVLDRTAFKDDINVYLVSCGHKMMDEKENIFNIDNFSVVYTYIRQKWREDGVIYFLRDGIQTPFHISREVVFRIVDIPYISNFFIIVMVNSHRSFKDENLKSLCIDKLISKIGDHNIECRIRKITREEWFG